MTDNEWLQNLKPGGKVIVDGGHRSVATVDRLTKTQIITTSGTRYRRKDGRLVGETGWCVTFLRQADTETIREVREENERRRLRNVVAHINTATLSLDQLRRIKAIVEESNDRT